MLRIVAALAFAVSIDLLLFDGRYTHAIERMTLTIFHYF